MHIRIETSVAQTPTEVFDGFTQALFHALAPPLLPMKVLRYDGIFVGAKVVVGLALGQTWTSLITEVQQSAAECYFIDQGQQLPIGIKSWTHRHVISDNGKGGSFIIDDITYTASLPLLAMVMYPFLWMVFKYRQPIYRSQFGGKGVY